MLCNRFSKIRELKDREELFYKSIIVSKDDMDKFDKFEEQEIKKIRRIKKIYMMG